MQVPSLVQKHFKEAAAWTGGALAVITVPFIAETAYRASQEQFNSLTDAFAAQTTIGGVAMAVGGALLAGIGATALNAYHKSLTGEEGRLRRDPSPKP